MRRLTVFLSIALILQFIPILLLAQRLPSGAYQTSRSRTYDILHYRADLSFDFPKKSVIGKATIQMKPLRRLQIIELDAILLDIQRVRIAGSDIELTYQTEDNTLEIVLPEEQTPDDVFSIEIDYTARPQAGMYFIPNPQNPDLMYVTTYGEDGLHANWLPIYGDTNDKFTTEMAVTVPSPYVAISNGKLLEKRTQPNGSTTFHWKQELPHANYLISIYVGDFEMGELPQAHGTVPVRYWVPRGRLQEGAHVFRNTTRMIEYFAKQFSYPYPWYKYDQIAIPDYAIGAMEHTGVTGHRASLLRTESAPVDFNPTLNHYADPWSAEALISHELAHHWFGNLVTCRSLSHLWLNESFATFLMLLWEEPSRGSDDYSLRVDLARQAYFSYVANEHIIRPLEYRYFDDANTIYNTEHTYYKGAVVLHMLRRIVGDENFFRALSHYLKQHEFQNVVSNDLKLAFEEATGENLQWFFEQWVTGGGHPVFEVTRRYVPARKQLALKVKQVQPFVDGQDLFSLPVRVTVRAGEQEWQEEIWVSEEEAYFALNCPSEPDMISFDGEGDLVAEIHFEKTAGLWATQARHDAVAGKLRALRNLAQNHPGLAVTHETFRAVLTDESFWGVRAEAASQLGHLRTSAAVELVDLALKDEDYRVRKAVAIALPKFGPPVAAKYLDRLIASDPHTSVVAAAVLARAKAQPEPNQDFFEDQLAKDSWYGEIKIAALHGCGEVAMPALVSLVKKYLSPTNNQHTNAAAIAAWISCTPGDPDLHRHLIDLTRSPVYSLQRMAIEKLGDLRVIQARSRLEEILTLDVDGNLTKLAREALLKIDSLQNGSNGAQ